MKDKVLARLKVKHPGVNLSKTRLEKISDYAVKKLPAEATEQDIDDFIDGLNELQPFAEIAKADDRQRLADKKAKDEAEAKAKTDAEAGKGGKEDDQDDTPKWAKTMIESNKALQARLDAIEKGKTVDNRTQKFLDTIKDAGEEYRAKELKKFQRMNFETEDDFNDYLQEAGTELASSKQADVNSTVTNGRVPRGTPGKAGEVKQASKEEVADVVSQIM